MPKFLTEKKFSWIEAVSMGILSIAMHEFAWLFWAVVSITAALVCHAVYRNFWNRKTDD